MDSPQQKLFDDARQVLLENDQGDWTMPAAHLYPHQWFWDSCFIAMGQRHYDVERAQAELESLLRGQWGNGMFPDMVFNEGLRFSHLDAILWDSALSPHAPKNVATSGITQPPMLAEAVWQVGQKLKTPARRTWFKKMLPHLVSYHQWLYRERDPRQEGLITIVHPYESGLDNSPPWLAILKITGIAWWVKVVVKLHLDFVVNLIRRDTRHTASAERMSTTEALSFFVGLRHLRNKGYDSKRILQKPYMAVQDLLFNSVLIHSNKALREIAKTAGVKLPEDLRANMKLSERALDELLWDPQEGRYFCRNFINGELIREPSVAGLIPLYAGTISHEHAERLVELLGKHTEYKSAWPVPSTPLNSSYFDPVRYWQGPSWININWLIIHGLRRYGFDDQANNLTQRTLELVAKSGFCEYYDPNTGEPHGAKNFSWSAALTIDLLKN